ncbi:MAG: hypothetical protein WCK42_07650 [Myxococcaceae bacterium]
MNSGDPIQKPAVPTGAGYIYNIMAKGYASLDDWCMSQAQQSTIPAMRNIGSWTAMVYAQGSNSEETQVANSYPYGGDSNYFGPGQTAAFSAQNNFLYDRNGSVQNSFSAWAGLQRQFCVDVVNSRCNGFGDWGTCKYWSAKCYLGSGEENGEVDDQVAITAYNVNPLACNGSGNYWANFSSGGGNTPMQYNPNGGVFALMPNNCLTAGFDFLVSCGYVGDTAHSACSNAHPIICLANQS